MEISLGEAGLSLDAGETLRSEFGLIGDGGVDGRPRLSWLMSGGEGVSSPDDGGDEVTMLALGLYSVGGVFLWTGGVPCCTGDTGLAREIGGGEGDMDSRESLLLLLVLCFVIGGGEGVNDSVRNLDRKVGLGDLSILRPRYREGGVGLLSSLYKVPRSVIPVGIGDLESSL